MTPDQILAIDKQRMEGLSAGEILAALTHVMGDEQGAQAFREYANTKMPDGRLRSQVNLGDPHEWSDER